MADGPTERDTEAGSEHPDDPHGEGAAMAPHAVQRLMCRLNLYHQWETRSTEDGSRYRRCAWCYVDGTGKWGRRVDPFGPINLTGRGPDTPPPR